MRKFSKQDDEAEVNMTPMLDIVFIMLIFFIVTATFTKKAGLDAEKPPPAPPEEPEDDKKNCLIKIDNNNQVRFGFRRIDIGSVRPNVEQCRAANPEAVVVIQPSPNTHTGLIIQAYDQANEVDPGVIQVLIGDPK